MKDEAGKWLKQAKADLRTARNSLKSKDFYASVFWSQQAVEKSLKAVIIEKIGELIKIHDLVILGRKSAIPDKLSIDCERLSKIYIDSRYGVIDNEIPAEKFGKKEADEFLKIARSILKWCEKEI
ncbi:HEPN domain-containing protein [Candidatus Pacearchaeota archaeon]|nr:HEPN domain-containing protein [Candidatus Pacearchaeota archaeon]